jgi:hypothetical protein
MYAKLLINFDEIRILKYLGDNNYLAISVNIYSTSDGKPYNEIIVKEIELTGELIYLFVKPAIRDTIYSVTAKRKDNLNKLKKLEV